MSSKKPKGGAPGKMTVDIGTPVVGGGGAIGEPLDAVVSSFCKHAVAIGAAITRSGARRSRMGISIVRSPTGGSEPARHRGDAAGWGGLHVEPIRRLAWRLFFRRRARDVPDDACRER